MDLSTAQGAVKALGNATTLEAAYHSYFSGHDDKHRSATKAYSANHGAANPNAPQGYFQKTGMVPVQTGTVMKSVWGKPPSAQPVFTDVAAVFDISPDEEKAMLSAAVKAGSGTYYRDRDADKFQYACPVPAGFKAFTFEGGGGTFPKKAKECSSMMLVISAGGSVHLVTLFTASTSFLGRQTAL